MIERLIKFLFKKGVDETGVNTALKEKNIFSTEIPKKKSFFEKLFNTNTEHDFQRFNTKIFIIGIIVLILAPPIASLAPFVAGRHARAKCVQYFFNENINDFSSILEYYPKDSKDPVLYIDDRNAFQEGESVDILYLPENPHKVIALIFFSLYTNFWTGITVGLFIIWVAAFYASRELNSN